MKTERIFLLLLAVGLTMQVAWGFEINSTFIYSHDFSTEGSLSADGWWVETAGEGVISNGYVSLYDKATYLFGDTYALTDDVEADHNVDALWVSFSVKVPTEGANGRAAVALGNSNYYTDTDGTDNQYEFGKFAGVWLYDDLSTATKTMCAGRLSTYTHTFDSDFMDFVFKISEINDQLQVQLWVNPADVNNLGDPQKTNTKSYDDKYTGMGYQGLFDQIELNAYNFTGGMQISSLVVWTDAVVGVDVESFTATPESFVVQTNITLAWETYGAGWIEIDDGIETIATYTASEAGQAALDSGSLVLGVVSNATTYTLRMTEAEDGSGAVFERQASVVPVEVDSDLDGLPDIDESGSYLTDPDERDSDGDGTPDGLEIERGLDPNDSEEYLERPNILFFFVDDLGYGDLGCFWQDQRTSTQKFDTPNIDALAAGGAMLTHHYVAASVCAPTRSSLLQGLHQGHATVRDNNFDTAIADNHTAADMLRRAGYRTIHIGKNGIAGEERSIDLSGTGSSNLAGHPLDRGFDEFFGYLFHGDAHEHYPQNGGTDKGAYIYNGYVQTTNASLDLYTTDAWTAYAKKAITEEVQDGDHQPFFLYLAYDTPHFKMQRPAVKYPAGGGLSGGIQWTTDTDDAGRVRYASTADGAGMADAYNHPDINTNWPTSNQQHVGMIRRIDNSMADIVALLDDLGVRDDTLIVFSSDNGPHNEGNDPRYFGSFANFEGIKRDLFEGGIRVPTIVNWPDGIQGATGDEDNILEIDYPCAIWDWMPTFAEVAQIPAPALCDGVSLLPTLTGEGVQRDKGYLYFEYYHDGSTPDWSSYFPNHYGERQGQMQCVRVGDYMGIRNDIENEGYDFRIYNVVTDLGQSCDLSSAMSELHQEMKDIALQARRPDSSASRPYDSENVPNASRSVQTGLDYSCYEGIWSFVPEFRNLSAVASGSVSNLDLKVRSRDDHYGVLYSGYIDVPSAGNYTFYLSSDTGASLFIHDAHVLDDDYHHDGSEQTGSINLEDGLHPFRLYYRHGRLSSYQLELAWSGPSLTKEMVPPSAFYHIPEIRMTLSSGDGLSFGWNSLSNQTYRLRASDTLSKLVCNWPIERSGIISTPPANTLNVPISTNRFFFYVVEEE
jgi:arylsulfatase A-like enzyme